MKLSHQTHWFCMFLVLAISWSVRVEAQDSNQVQPKHPELRTELLERMERDQAARQKMTVLFGPNANDVSAEERMKILTEVTKIDAENFDWIKEKVDELGWLGKTAVGKDGASAAWLIVQHCDRHPKFQRRCLGLMTAMPEGEVDIKNLAYLTDRVLRAEGKPIRYGTQMMQVDGKLTVGDVEDPENLDKRRAEIGLGPMSEYMKLIESVGNPAPKPKTLDAHVHLLSPQLLEDWKTIGMSFSRDKELYCNPAAILKEVGTDQIVAVSMAHLYSTEWFQRLEHVRQAEAVAVSKENDFIADCVSQSDGKLYGFFSANPLRGYAQKEFDRCAENQHLTGLKLHLPACSVSMLVDEHVKVLVAIFRWAEQKEIPILIHLASASTSEFGLAGAKRFWSDVVAPFPKIRLMVAHCGASGGFNDNSSAVLNGYLELVKTNKAFETSTIYFDLSGAILAESTDGFEPTSDNQIKKLAAAIRQIGIKKFLPATDYPAFEPGKVWTVLEKKLGLSEEETKELLSNRPSFLTTPN